MRHSFVSTFCHQFGGVSVPISKFTVSGIDLQPAAPHPVREYADNLRGKFRRFEAVAMSDIERLLDLIEEHL